jgi:hypothetical protein
MRQPTRATVRPAGTVPGRFRFHRQPDLQMKTIAGMVSMAPAAMRGVEKARGDNQIGRIGYRRG